MAKPTEAKAEPEDTSTDTSLQVRASPLGGAASHHPTQHAPKQHTHTLLFVKLTLIVRSLAST
jgi:hypothetical protein